MLANLRDPLLMDRQVPLINLADDPSQVSVNVELWCGIAEDLIPEEEGIWWALAHRFKQPDKGWKWREIIESAERQDRDHTFLFSVIYKNKLQAIMLVHQTSELLGDVNSLYVSWLCNAAWNRGTLRCLPEWDFYRTNYPDWPYLKGIGRLLIATAAKLSVALGWKGKLTLNSVPEAVDFYVNACHFEIKGSVAPGVCTKLVLTEVRSRKAPRRRLTMDFADLKLSKVWHEKNRLNAQTSGHEIVFAASIDSPEAQQPVRNSNELTVAAHRSSGTHLKAYG